MYSYSVPTLLYGRIDVTGLSLHSLMVFRVISSFLNSPLADQDARVQFTLTCSYSTVQVRYNTAEDDNDILGRISTMAAASHHFQASVTLPFSPTAGQFKLPAPGQ